MVTHQWIVRGKVYCSPGCERGKPVSKEFKPLYRAFKNYK